MFRLIEKIVPITAQAWKDYQFESMRLSRLEIDAIKAIAKGGDGTLATENKREQAEWQSKRTLLGL
jgi:hypothetical protein